MPIKYGDSIKIEKVLHGPTERTGERKLIYRRQDYIDGSEKPSSDKKGKAQEEKTRMVFHADGGVTGIAEEAKKAEEAPEAEKEEKKDPEENSAQDAGPEAVEADSEDIDSADKDKEKDKKSRKKSGKRRSSAVLTVLLVVCIGVFCYSGYRLISWYVNSQKEKAGYEDLRNEITVTTGDSGDTTQTSYEKYQRLFDANEDMCGWLRIDGTNIDYPVMYTPSNPEKYLRMSFYGEYALGGTLFVGAGCTISPRSDNVIIYGHNMTDDTMFHELVYYEDPEFLAENPYVEFDTKEEFGTYQIIYAIKTVVYTSDDWEYYNFINADSEEEFNSFIQSCEARELYDSGYTAEYGDELLTLSTCEYSQENGRMVIIAKKISSSETISTSDSQS